MKRRAKIWLTIAVALVSVGCVLFIGVMTVLKWDFKKLSTSRYVTNVYEITEEFEHLSLKTDTADIVLALAEDGRCRVECYEDEKAKHTAAVENGTLSVEVEDKRTVLDHIGLHFEGPTVTVYLPKAAYASLRIEGKTGGVEIPSGFTFTEADVSVSTGAVRAEGISVGTLAVHVTTGKVTVSDVSCVGDVTVNVTTGQAVLRDVSCKSLRSSGDTGDLLLDHVIAAERISVERSTGDVRFDGSDAAALFVETDTGDVSGSLLTDKVFIAESDTGRVTVPHSENGGRCELRTDTGDITVRIQEE